MEKSEIIQIGDPLLLTKSKPIKSIKSKGTQELIERLIVSLDQANLVWLAAVQIWISKRIFVTEIKATKFRTAKDLDELRVFINPEIVHYSKTECIIYEWCWSVGDGKIFAPVKRPTSITVEAFDRKGEKFRLSVSWMISRIIQHENDHLEWINFMERVTDFRKLMSPENYRKYILKRPEEKVDNK